MKKIICILLLFIYMLQAGGMLLIYRVQVHRAKHEMEQVLNKEQPRFVKLTITLKDFQKASINSHEISFRGKMYDIKSKSISGQTVELLVLHDAEEESIMGNIESLFNTKKNKEFPRHLIKLITLFYTVPNAEHLFLSAQFHQNNFYSLIENIISISLDILSPPPDLG